MTVEEGQAVRPGQLLAVLDLTEINAAVMQANQNVEKLQRDYDRVNNLHKENAATLEQLQNIATALEVAKTISLLPGSTSNIPPSMQQKTEP